MMTEQFDQSLARTEQQMLHLYTHGIPLMLPSMQHQKLFKTSCLKKCDRTAHEVGALTGRLFVYYLELGPQNVRF